MIKIDFVKIYMKLLWTESWKLKTESKVNEKIKWNRMENISFLLCVKQVNG